MTVTNRNIKRVLEIVREHNKEFREPAVSLVARHHTSPFHVLITTLISLRTKDEVTAPAATRLFALADTPHAMAALPARRIATTIYPAGFYKTKAKTIRLVSRIIVERYGGIVPDDIDELVTLPGVGRKTANLVLTDGYKRPAVCVDTHVHRISNRWGYVATRTPDETEQALREKLPMKYWITYNYLLVTFGQTRCTPVSPYCGDCPLKRLCPRMGVARSR